MSKKHKQTMSTECFDLLICLSAWCLPGVATHVIKCERPTERRGGHSTMLRASPSAWMKAGSSR